MALNKLSRVKNIVFLVKSKENRQQVILKRLLYDYIAHNS